jgi:5-methylcytosine-specific restriction protein A
VALLYYWQRFRRDTIDGPIFKLNQNNSLLADLQSGDTVWALTLSAPGAYAIAAEFKVATAGENAEGDPERPLGRYFFVADSSRSRFFDIDKQASAEPLIRSLNITANASVLGQSFQGQQGGVRRLDEADHVTLADYAKRLNLDERLSGSYLIEVIAASLLSGAMPPEKRERLLETYVRNQRHVRKLKGLYGGCCQICGASPFGTEFGEITEAHHIDWLCRGGQDKMENLILLCPNHHAAIHAKDPTFDRGRLEFRNGTMVLKVVLDRHLKS